MLCTEFSLLRQDANCATYTPLYCNSWQCPTCNPRRRKRLKKEAHRGQPNTFITLTVNPHWGESPDARAQLLVKAWREIRRRAEKELGIKHISFIAVFEQTKRGEPHLHILARTKFIPQRWLSEKMRLLMSAPVVDIRRVKGKRKVANYVTKYVGKDPHSFAGTKRYWRSLDWLLDAAERAAERIGVRFIPIRAHVSQLEREAVTTGFSMVETLGREQLFIAWWNGGIKCRK